MANYRITVELSQVIRNKYRKMTKYTQSNHGIEERSRNVKDHETQ